MTEATSAGRRTRLAGYLFALGAGALWGTTGPLSTALYAEGGQLTSVGFWRVLLAVLGFAVVGVFRRELWRIDRKGVLVVGLLGGALVAVFEVAYQYAIAGVGVAPAVALLYTAPVIVAVLARVLLGEALTPLRLLLAAAVMVGVALAVHGGPEATAGRSLVGPSARAVGIASGALAALSYAGSTLMARWAVPRYGSARVLFWELLGGVVLLALLLPPTGHPIAAPGSAAGWAYVAALGIGAVVLANFCFFAGVRRIDAAPAAVAASAEPVVGALLALALFGQGLTASGWVGLAMVVGGVAGGYRAEAEPSAAPAGAAAPAAE
ncbi:MAG: DMT family transporter [Gemmatimonadetes bacterium]|nr:DMT family transporter [Gemmatimonadota bacterium]